MFHNVRDFFSALQLFTDVIKRGRLKEMSFMILIFTTFLFNLSLSFPYIEALYTITRSAIFISLILLERDPFVNFTEMTEAATTSCQRS